MSVERIWEKFEKIEIEDDASDLGGAINGWVDPSDDWKTKMSTYANTDVFRRILYESKGAVTPANTLNPAVVYEYIRRNMQIIVDEHIISNKEFAKCVEVASMLSRLYINEYKIAEPNIVAIFGREAGKIIINDVYDHENGDMDSSVSTLFNGIDIAATDSVSKIASMRDTYMANDRIRDIVSRVTVDTLASGTLDLIAALHETYPDMSDDTARSVTALLIGSAIKE